MLMIRNTYYCLVFHNNSIVGKILIFGHLMMVCQYGSFLKVEVIFFFKFLHCFLDLPFAVLR